MACLVAAGDLGKLVLRKQPLIDRAHRFAAARLRVHGDVIAAERNLDIVETFQDAACDLGLAKMFVHENCSEASHR